MKMKVTGMQNEGEQDLILSRALHLPPGAVSNA